MWGACMFKDQTLKKTRTLLFPEAHPAVTYVILLRVLGKMNSPESPRARYVILFGNAQDTEITYFRNSFGSGTDQQKK